MADKKAAIIKENNQKVYNAGKLKTLSKSKYMHPTVSGSAIRVDDVNSIEHNVGVKLSSDTVADFSGIEVARYGKNLWSLKSTFTRTGYTCSFSSSNAACKEMFARLPRGVSLRLSYKIEGDGTDTSLTAKHVYVKYADGTTIEASNGLFNLQDKEVTQLTLYGRQNVTSQNFYDMQIELGNNATEYEPYIEPQTVKANAEGVVEGLTSLAPTMTLIPSSNEVIIEMEYFRDIDLALENQIIEIAMSGGE